MLVVHAGLPRFKTARLGHIRALKVHTHGTHAPALAPNLFAASLYSVDGTYRPMQQALRRPSLKTSCGATHV